MRNTIVTIGLASSLLLTACGADPAGAPTCMEPSVRRADWANFTTQLVTRTGSAVHSAQDVVTADGASFTIEGKFAYGPSSKDLEGEAVTAFVEVESGGCAWRELDTVTTDDDGRARVDVDTERLGGPGVYRFRFIVNGDQSAAEGNIWVLGEDPRAVVFDLDGTITTSDLEVVGDFLVFTVENTSEELFDLAGLPVSKSQLLFGLEKLADEPATYPGAFDLVHHYAEQGYLPVYITARPYLFDEVTRTWMAEHLPPGPLFMTQDVDDSMPERVAGYKQRRIDALEALGVEVEAAYGNAETDICAYAQAEIPSERTYIVGPYAGSACEGFQASQPITDYRSHLKSLKSAR